MDLKEFENPFCVWKPTAVDKFSNYAKFVKTIEEKYEVKIDTYWDLHKWSIENIENFWAEVWYFAEIKYSKNYEKVVDLSVPMSQSPKWFVGAKLNFAENLLRFRDNHIALIGIGEDRVERQVTYSELYEEVKCYAAAFRKIGLKKGDKVVCYMSNREEAVFAMLATASVGALWIGVLPMLGAQAVLDRLVIIHPKYIISVDQMRYEERHIDMLPKLKTISNGVTSLEKIIIVPSKEDSIKKDIRDMKKSCFLHEFLALGKNADGSVPDLVFEQVSVSHPVFISYTSGTTGLPKAILHGNGRILGYSRDRCLQGSKSRQGVSFCVSPAGWASWFFGPTTFFSGDTAVLYDGVPYYLSPTYFWDIIDKYKITNFFVTPSIMDELEKKGYVPTENHKLTNLLLVFAGGSVVKPQNYEFAYQKVKKNMLFLTAYGSSEISGGCLSFHRTLPVYKGEHTCPSLGVDLQVLNEAGGPIVGEIGELVLAKSCPLLPLGLYGDEDGSKYRETYFSKYREKFLMGDLAAINPKTRGVVVYCRNDEDINQFGCRFGSSEIYNVVNRLPEVHDSLCVSQYSKSGTERAVLFLKLKEGFKFSDELVEKIKTKIDKELTDEHIPGLIMEVPDIPYNMNGKKMEILVKKMLKKMPFSTDVLRNKESIQHFMNVPPFED